MGERNLKKKIEQINEQMDEPKNKRKRERGRKGRGRKEDKREKNIIF